MYYIATLKNSLSNLSALCSDDKLIYFCKPDDKFAVPDVQRLLEAGRVCEMEMIPCGTREQQAMVVGGYLCMGEECTFMDVNFEVPQMFADLVTVMKGQKSQAKKKSVNKKKSEPAIKAESAKTNSSAMPEQKDAEPDAKDNPVPETPQPAAELFHEPASAAPAAMESDDMDEEVLPGDYMPLPEPDESEEFALPVQEIVNPETGEWEPPIQEEDDSIPELPSGDQLDIASEFSSADNKKLFDLIGIRSEDIGFSWKTDMLMGQILRMAEESDTGEELLSLISTIRPGKNKRLINACTPVLDQIIAIARG